MPETKKMKRTVRKVAKPKDEEQQPEEQQSGGKDDWFTEPFKVFKKEIEHSQIEKSFRNLTEKLSLKTNRMSTEHLISAIDSAAHDYFGAGDLYLIAYNELRKFETYYEIRMAELNDEAQKELEEKKKNKEITSQITQALKEAWIIENRRETYQELKNTLRQLKVALYRFETLKQAWAQRMSMLQSQARVIEKKVMLTNK